MESRVISMFKRRIFQMYKEDEKFPDKEQADFMKKRYMEAFTHIKSQFQKELIFGRF